MHGTFTRRNFLATASALLYGGSSNAAMQAPTDADQGKVYIVLWFDTEDYILPQSDDAAKRVAAFLTAQGVRATFKMVGEKARTLERRRRDDVIGALSLHEIGYHSNTHSQHPTVAEYESLLDWPSGVEEFTRRERQGFEDVWRIFGQTPSCYGQPGNSWAPQAYGALNAWGVKVYLDDGLHVGLNGKPFWYGGLLNIFNISEGHALAHNADWSNLEEAKAGFRQTYARLTADPRGGVVSFMYHPCEFVHKEFWDAVNFARGANPPRESWKLPSVKTPEESGRAFKFFEELVSYIKSSPRAEFVTASEAYRLYSDAAQQHVFSPSEIADIAQQVRPEVGFQVRSDYALAASEVLVVLNKFVSGVVRHRTGEPIRLGGTPYGPDSAPAELKEKIEIPWSQFASTALDVGEYLEKNQQVPSAIWMGSTAVPPESYLVTLAEVTTAVRAKGAPPQRVVVAPAQLAAGQYVADDSPQVWQWPIFPVGFHSPHLLTLGRLQAWTLKPALL